MQKIFKDHLDQAICYLASFKSCTSKTKLRRFCIKPLKYLIMIEHDTVGILNPEPCWDDALSVVLSATSTSRIIANWYLEKVCCNLWFDSAKPFGIGSGLRPSLEYFLNYKIFSGFPSLDKAAKDFTGSVSQQLVLDSYFWLGAMQINFHIFQGSSISKSSIMWG